MITAAQVIDYIHGAAATGKKSGLRNTKALLDRLGCPFPPVLVHVAGTNGKGSTCAMVERILRAAGYRTGLYSSPFLQSYQERIRLDGVPVSDALLTSCGAQLIPVAEELAHQGIHCQPFELGTALAMLVFAKAGVEAAVVEVGLGGRLDPTNVLPATLCGIAAIGMDHMAILGDTLSAIAGEKAGIMRPQVPVVAGINPPEVTRVFAARAAETAAPLTQLTPDMVRQESHMPDGNTASFQLQQRWDDLHIPLPGSHQVRNALLAVALVEGLMAQGLSITPEDVRAGIAQTTWPGRLEWAGNVLMDGAHNAQGMAALNQFVQSQLNRTRYVLLVGMLQDKDTPAMEKEIITLAQGAIGVVTVTPSNPKALPAGELASRLSVCDILPVAAYCLADGLQQAKRMAAADEVVIAAGSLYLVGELRTLLGIDWK